MKIKAVGLIVLLGALLPLANRTTLAHHAMISQYATNKPITLKGTLVSVEWVNPHSWIRLSVPTAEGAAEEWAVETGSPYQMEKGGLKKTYFRPGQAILIGGFLAKDGTRNVAGTYIVFPERESHQQLAVFALGR
jgi:uncharacterized protein DUF6152